MKLPRRKFFAWLFAPLALTLDYKCSVSHGDEESAKVLTGIIQHITGQPIKVVPKKNSLLTVKQFEKETIELWNKHMGSLRPVVDGTIKFRVPPRYAPDDNRPLMAICKVPGCSRRVMWDSKNCALHGGVNRIPPYQKKFVTTVSMEDVPHLSRQYTNDMRQIFHRDARVTGEPGWKWGQSVALKEGDVFTIEGKAGKFKAGKPVTS